MRLILKIKQGLVNYWSIDNHVNDTVSKAYTTGLEYLIQIQKAK